MTIYCWTIGKQSENYVKEGILLFYKRIEHYYPISWQIIPPPKQAANIDILVLKEEEG